MSDLQQRVDHILGNQIFGIGITSLTSLLSRRSLYCSKYANSEHSITKVFQNDAGNIWFDRVEHEWIGASNFIDTADTSGNTIRRGTNGKCKYCGAPQIVFDRDSSLETHAYAFIHTDDIKNRLNQLFGGSMQFDVVIGNPPYQAVKDGDYSLWARFIKKGNDFLLPLGHLIMIVPQGWLSPTNDIREGRISILRDILAKQETPYVNLTRALKEHFNGIGSTFSVIYTRNNPSLNNTTVFETDEGNVQVEMNKLIYLPKGRTTAADIRIFAKVFRK
jgi:site-specific DNA-methyltransferase (adenine-specific)